MVVGSVRVGDDVWVCVGGAEQKGLRGWTRRTRKGFRQPHADCHREV